MHVWLIKAGEALPSDETNDRLKRMGILANKLVEQGHKVTWFNSSFNHARKIQRTKEDKLINIEKGYDIQLIRANSYKRNVSIERLLHHSYTAQRFKAIISKVEKPDIILASMPTIELMEIAVKYGNKNNLPVIVDIRDLWPDIYSEVLPKWMNKMIKPYIWYTKKRLHKSLKNATALTALTSGFLEWGLSYAKRSRSELDQVFKMGYKKVVNEENRSLKEWSDYNITKNDFIICFFGNLGKQFNFDPIIKAAKLLRDENIKFVICGNGESLPILKEQTKDLNNIIFPGWINQTKIQSLLSIAHIGIAPYRQSINFTMNIPNKFGEYLSAGLPVLLGINGEMGNLVKENKCGFVYEESGEMLAQQVIKLKKHSLLRKEMSQNALELFEEEFNADKVYIQMTKYLENISNTYKKF